MYFSEVLQVRLVPKSKQLGIVGELFFVVQMPFQLCGQWQQSAEGPEPIVCLF